MTGPSITPAPGRFNLLLGTFDLAGLGYVAAEFFVAGEASSFMPARPLGADGNWETEPAGSARYATRIVVLRPADDQRFDGTVLVEWLNVTAGLDAPADWLMAHREIVRSGHAYVAVSAQRVGIEGGSSRGADLSLRATDPDRYGSLHHPGDAYCFDIFSQAGRLLRDRPAALLGDLRPERIIAVGESQSAMYLVTYVNAIDRQAAVYDGFLVHSRFAPSGPLDGSPSLGERSDDMPEAPRLRAGLRVPVLTVITETDLVGGMRQGFHAARQPDSGLLRTWEIAGTAHADIYTVQVAFIDDGSLPIARLASAYAPTRSLMGLQLEQCINFAPQHHYVLQAALHGLVAWVRSGTPPAEAPRLALDGAAAPALVPDGHGIATGGIRTPWVDVPVARTSGAGTAADAIASLFGSGEPFDHATLQRLYPGGRPDYLARFGAALDAAIGAGFLLEADRPEIVGLAEASYPIG